MNSVFRGREEEIRKKALNKSSRIFSIPGSVLPDSSVIEQASGELSSGFVASLVPDGSVVADLTAGLGINSLAFSDKAKKVFAVEMDESRALALRHNLELCGAENIEVVHSECLEWLQSVRPMLDVIFVDPARRDVDRRVFRLEDSSPRLSDILAFYQEAPDTTRPRIIVKASPLLDIDYAVNSVPGVSAVYIVEANGEVKELLLDIGPNLSVEHDDVAVNCVRLKPGETQLFSFSLKEKYLNDSVPLASSAKDIEVGGYLYEPSAALMKSGLHGALASRFPDLVKLARDTHLFYSNSLQADFPGRIFRIEGFESSSSLKKKRGSFLNVISRNHPAKAPEIEQRYRLKTSDTDFLIFCTVGPSKSIFLTHRLQLP